MFVLIENVSPFKNMYIYDVFDENSEINYSNKLFTIKIYYMESEHFKIKNQLDVFIYEFNKINSLEKEEYNNLINMLKKQIFQELCELDIEEFSQINISIAGD